MARVFGHAGLLLAVLVLSGAIALRLFDPAVRGHTDQVILKFRKPPSAASPVAGPPARRHTGLCL